jgi:alpha-D-xyloside xylohydrolase
MKKIVLLWSVLIAGIAGCSEKKLFRKFENGVVVIPVSPTGGAKKVRLEVVTDQIIRVSVTPTDSFSTGLSLMRVPVPAKPTWTLKESSDELILSTNSLRAHVSLSTGEVAFSDMNGTVIAREKAGGGKKFDPFITRSISAYSIQQVFESSDDEAFYGLGGHQNGQMNYKGEDVQLVQHNIVDVVPFLYSSKNYGILWDNYSISKFGDVRDFASLNSVGLSDREGRDGALTATYYVHDKVVREVREDKIEYEFLETPQVENFPRDVSRNGKVVWEGFISSEVVGAHKFQVYSSGYIKIWIDGDLILDKWRQNWNPWTNKFTVQLSKGQKRTIKIEWVPDDAGYLGVRHLDPLPADDQNRLSLWSEVADNIDYYFIRGNSADDVISGYRTLTGKAPIVPDWALGFWQSRERYKTSQELTGVVKEYRKRKIPLDNIVLDWQYWEDPKWGSHEFDRKRFPDPKGMVDEIHNDLNAHIMISVWPKFNKGTDNYEAMNKQGFLFTKNVEMKRKDWVGIGYESTFYDPFSSEAGKLFWKQIDERLNSIGIDAWWLDATEPDMHSNISIEARKENMSPTSMGPGEKYFNAFSLVNSKSVYEGQRQSSPEKRVFILTRSSYAGQQRYGAATWSGDIVSRWSDFQDQIATGINFSLSGIPYWTMDIGGFSVERRFANLTGETQREWRELNTRWFQFGAFCPLFRSHGQFPFREIYNIAPEGSREYESMVYYTRLRYRLMPYIYSIAGHAYHSDYTIMRGLVMDFNADIRARNIADQYMFGPAILVAPVYEDKAVAREVYLPSGTGWFDFYTGKKHEGGRSITAAAPLERMPLYVREGSIIPAGPQIQFAGEKSADPMTLYVFGGQDAAFTLYEDEGRNYNYEQGRFSTIEIIYNDASKRLTIGERKGAFTGMPEQRKFEIVWVKDEPVGVALVATPHQVVEYSGSPVSVTMNPTK